MDTITNEITVLYEDGVLIVAEKPCGIPSVNDPSTDVSVTSLLAAHRGADGSEPVVINRLDRGVGGIIVLAKTKKSAAYLSAEIQDHERFQKEYRAVVLGAPPTAGEWQDLLFKDSARNKTFVVKRMRRGVKEASLSFRSLSAVEGERTLTLVGVRLHTGRTHQIRVQFSSRGFPLIGDGKYGGPSDKYPALHAYKMSFLHPNGERMTFVSQPPARYPWTLFPNME